MDRRPAREVKKADGTLEGGHLDIQLPHGNREVIYVEIITCGVSVRINAAPNVARGDTLLTTVNERRAAMQVSNKTLSSELSVLLPVKLANSPLEMILDSGSGPSVIDIRTIRSWDWNNEYNGAQELCTVWANNRYASLEISLWKST